MSMRKKILAVTMAGAMALSMAACGSGTSGNTAAPADNGAAPVEGEILGNALTYDTSVPVNNGEKIELTLWTDPEPQPYYEELAEKYHAIHENVTIKVVSQPWEDYWTKLPLALEAGNGPDLYRGHAGYIPRSTPMSFRKRFSPAISWRKTSPSMRVPRTTASCTPFLSA